MQEKKSHQTKDRTYSHLFEIKSFPIRFLFVHFVAFLFLLQNKMKWFFSFNDKFEERFDRTNKIVICITFSLRSTSICFCCYFFLRSSIVWCSQMDRNFTKFASKWIVPLQWRSFWWLERNFGTIDWSFAQSISTDLSTKSYSNENRKFNIWLADSSFLQWGSVLFLVNWSSKRKFTLPMSFDSSAQCAVLQRKSKCFCQ